MARATFVKAARKDVSEDVCGIEGGIKKGESYYWWKFRFGGKRYSKTPPRRSQLTQSAFYGTLYEIEDSIGELKSGPELPDDLRAIAEELRELATECEDSHSNMPDSLQESETGQLLQDRAEACNNAADELDSLADNMHEEDKGDKQTAEEYWQEQLEEAQNFSVDVP